MKKPLLNSFSIGIIGTGRIAFHLTNMFFDQVKEIRVYGRDIKALERFQKQFKISIGRLTEEIVTCDIYIIAVSDNAIAEVAKGIATRIKNKDAIICHTSGTTPISSISNYWQNAGSFYPLQTFSQNRIPDYHKIPFFLTGNNEFVVQKLGDLSQHLGLLSYQISDDRKRHLHLSAVVINNHINHLIFLAQQYCQDHQVPFGQLSLLLDETVYKANDIGALQAQTGPARRQDETTISKHLHMLEEYPLFQEIYAAISDSISLTYINEDH